MQKWRKQIKGAHQVLSKSLKTKFILRYACRIKNIKNKEKILKLCVCCSWCGRVFTERKTIAYIRKRIIVLASELSPATAIPFESLKETESQPRTGSGQCINQ